MVRGLSPGGDRRARGKPPRPYPPGSPDWVKVKSRETTEVIIGAVTWAAGTPGHHRGGPYGGRSVTISSGRALPCPPRWHAPWPKC